MADTVVRVVGKDQTGRAFANVRKGLNSLPPEAKKTSTALGRAFDSVAPQLGPVGKALSTVKNALSGPAGMVAAAGAAATAFTAFTAKVIGSASELQTAAERTGYTASQMKLLKNAAEEVNEDLGTAEGLIETFNERIQEATQGTGEGAAVFKELGISITDVNGNTKSSQQLLAEYAKRVNNMSDQTQAAAYNTRLLGGDGFKLISTLKGQEDQLTKTNAQFDAGAKAAKEVSKEWKAFTRGVREGISAAILPLVPYIKDLFTFFQDIGNELRERFQPAWDELAQAFQFVQPYLVQIGQILFNTWLPVLTNIGGLLVDVLIDGFNAFRGVLRRILPDGFDFSRVLEGIVTVMRRIGAFSVTASGELRVFAVRARAALNPFSDDEEVTGRIQAIRDETQGWVENLEDAGSAAEDVAAKVGPEGTTDDATVTGAVGAASKALDKFKETLESIDNQAVVGLLESMYRRADETDAEFQKRRQDRAKAALDQEIKDRREALKTEGDERRNLYEAISGVNENIIRKNSDFLISENSRVLGQIIGEISRARESAGGGKVRTSVTPPRGVTSARIVTSGEFEFSDENIARSLLLNAGLTGTVRPIPNVQQFPKFAETLVSKIADSVGVDYNFKFSNKDRRFEFGFFDIDQLSDEQDRLFTKAVDKGIEQAQIVADYRLDKEVEVQSALDFLRGRTRVTIRREIKEDIDREYGQRERSLLAQRDARLKANEGASEEKLQEIKDEYDLALDEAKQLRDERLALEKERIEETNQLIRDEAEATAKEQRRQIKENFDAEVAAIKEAAEERKRSVEAFSSDLSDAIDGLLAGTTSWGNAFQSIWQGVVNRIRKSIADDIADGIVNAVTKGRGAFEGLAAGLPGLFGGFFSFLNQGFAAVIQNAARGFDALGQGIQGIFANLVGGGRRGGFGGFLANAVGGFAGNYLGNAIGGGFGKFFGNAAGGAFSGLLGGSGGGLGGFAGNALGNYFTVGPGSAYYGPAFGGSTFGGPGAGGGLGKLFNSVGGGLQNIGKALGGGGAGATALGALGLAGGIYGLFSLLSPPNRPSPETQRRNELLGNLPSQSTPSIYDFSSEQRQAILDIGRIANLPIHIGTAFKEIRRTSADVREIADRIASTYGIEGNQLELVREILRSEGLYGTGPEGEPTGYGTGIPGSPGYAEFIRGEQDYSSHLIGLRDEIKANRLALDPSLLQQKRFYQEHFPKQTGIIDEINAKIQEQLGAVETQNELLASINQALQKQAEEQGTTVEELDYQSYLANRANILRGNLIEVDQNLLHEQRFLSEHMPHQTQRIEELGERLNQQIIQAEEQKELLRAIEAAIGNQPAPVVNVTVSPDPDNNGGGGNNNAQETIYENLLPGGSFTQLPVPG